jgi:hypothetical protein
MRRGCIDAQLRVEYGAGMTTQLQLDDELVRQARAEAQRQGMTLDALVADILRQRLPSSPGHGPQPGGGLPTHDLGGPKAGVDFDNGRALRDLMDQDGLARC